MNMKILIVADDYFNNTNGMCISTQRFVGKLRERGHEVRVMANSRNGSPDYPLSVMRIPFFAGIIEKEGFAFARPDKRILQTAIAWADVVHIEEGFPICASAAKMAKAMGKPCTGTFHLYPESITMAARLDWARPLTHLLWQMFRRTYNHCKIIQCPTDAVKDQLIRRAFHSEKRVISNGISDEWLDLHHTEKPEKYADKFIILSIGRFSREKRQLDLLEAVKRSKHADSIQIILAGKGPLRLELENAGKTLPS